MPTYEYSCTRCGHTFEAIQKISDEPLKECPECGAEAERLISGGAGLVFKGPGFYATDYKKAEQRRPEGGSGDSSEGKGESPEGTAQETTDG